MSTLFVVRHGQASFFEDDYDRLSELGREQSRLLGTYWAARDVLFDQVISGPRLRQRDTAQLVGEAYQSAGKAWPEPRVMEHFDEYQAEAVMTAALPMLLETNPQVRRLHEKLQATEGSAAIHRAFQRVYEVVIAMWARDELDLPDVERFAPFCERVHQGIEQLVASSADGGQRIALFTSGGPAGIVMQRALGTSDLKALQIAWMVRNGSFSEFLFSGQRFTLSAFNSLPHLDESRLLTYR
jgi:broad specificity phosphatase PhoE